MRVFISWSKPRSLGPAKALHAFLRRVLQHTTPFVSDRDVRSGAVGLNEIHDALRDARFGIVCVTSDNWNEPWLNYEAGAIANQVTEPKVCALLLDVDQAQVSAPLARFQYRKATKEGVFELVKDVNNETETRLASDELADLFEKFWPDLEKAIQDMPAAESDEEPQRDSGAVLGEILNIVRDMSRTVTRVPIWMQDLAGTLATQTLVVEGKAEAGILRGIIEKMPPMAYTEGTRVKLSDGTEGVIEQTPEKLRAGLFNYMIRLDDGTLTRISSKAITAIIIRPEIQ